jgi:arginase family enzyme
LKAVILDTDNSVKRQGLDQHFAMDTTDLADIRTNLQFYADRHGQRAFKSKITSNKDVEPILHLLGSGDFHHLTLMILEQLSAPFLLVVFDNHTDCSSLGPKYHCGNWLYHAAQLPHCRKILHVGATEGRGILSWYTGIHQLLNEGKLVLLPGRDLTGPDCIETFIDAFSFLRSVRSPVYVSVDKDVLAREESPGDWDNGVMSMANLRMMLAHIVRTYPVTGADITGEMGGRMHYPWNPLKNILSLIEHRTNRNCTPLASAAAQQRTLNLEFMSILGVPHVG